MSLPVIRPPKEQSYGIGPVLHLIDAETPSATGPQMISAAINCLLVQTDLAPRVMGRPGLQKMTGQLGTTHQGQLITQFTRLNGDTYTVAIVGGRLYKYNWGNDTWSEPVTTANFTTASITLSATEPCYALTFSNQLVVSDGVNTPWMWDGTTGAGGLTKLTNCPVLYGQPVIYYSKLFGIKATERSTIVWSEEADAATGYEAGNYNNAWTFGQTGTSPLVALAGTNAALTIFRERGITQIRGAVNDQFSSTGVQDAVSQQIGTLSPAGVLVWDSSVYFLGSDRHFYRISDDGFTPVGHGHRTALEAIPTNKLPFVQAALWWGAPNQRFLVWGLAESGATLCTRYLVLRADDGAAAGTFTGWQADRLGQVVDDDENPRLAVAGWGAATAGSQGYIYALGNFEGTVWSDQLAAGTVPIYHQITTGFVGWDEQVDKDWTRLDLSFLASTDLTGASLRATTPRTAGTALTIPTLTGSLGGKWDDMVWDTGEWAGSVETERKVSVGLAKTGRWCQIVFAHDTAEEQFVFHSGRVTASLRDMDPRSY